MKKNEQSVKDLKLKADLNYNAKSFLIQTVDAKNILDYIRRIENLNAVYELLMDKVNLAVTCNDCPFIEGCIYQEGKVDNCQIKMFKRTENLGISI